MVLLRIPPFPFCSCIVLKSIGSGPLRTVEATSRAERAKESPYLPTPNLAFTMDNLAVLNLPAREDKALAQHRAALEQHMAADRWRLLIRPASALPPWAPPARAEPRCPSAFWR